MKRVFARLLALSLPIIGALWMFISLGFAVIGLMNTDYEPRTEIVAEIDASDPNSGMEKSLSIKEEGLSGAGIPSGTDNENGRKTIIAKRIANLVLSLLSYLAIPGTIIGIILLATGFGLKKKKKE